MANKENSEVKEKFITKMHNKLVELSEINDDNLYHGTKPQSECDGDWNFFVFGKENTQIEKKEHLSANIKYFVEIIQENFIDEELIFKIVEKLEELPGVKVTNEIFPNAYISKGNTSVVCEMTRITFFKTIKRQNAIDKS